MLLETAGTVATNSSSNHVTVKGDVVQTAEEADEIALLLPDAYTWLIECTSEWLAGLLVFSCVCCRIETCVIRITPIFVVAPLVTSHDVEVLSLEEVFIILCIGREGEVIFLFKSIAAIAIIEVRRTPVGIIGILLTICPVTAGIGMETKIFETMNLIVNLYITHIVVRISPVVTFI